MIRYFFCSPKWIKITHAPIALAAGMYQTFHGSCNTGAMISYLMDNRHEEGRSASFKTEYLFAGVVWVWVFHLVVQLPSPRRRRHCEFMLVPCLECKILTIDVITVCIGALDCCSASSPRLSTT